MAQLCYKRVDIASPLIMAEWGDGGAPRPTGVRGAAVARVSPARDHGLRGARELLALLVLVRLLEELVDDLAVRARAVLARLARQHAQEVVQQPDARLEEASANGASGASEGEGEGGGSLSFPSIHLPTAARRRAALARLEHARLDEALRPVGRDEPKQVEDDREPARLEARVLEQRRLLAVAEPVDDADVRLEHALAQLVEVPARGARCVSIES